jgi:glucan phosphoethanolaminetransferase (alkaline phosphatase superfamily)
LIFRLVQLAAKTELLNVRQRLTNLFLILPVILFIFIAFIFALVGAFLWISEYLPAWQAALCVSGALLVFSALILGFISVSNRRRRQSRPIEDLQKELETMASSFLQETRQLPKKNRWQLIAAATLVGIIIGRSIGK